MTQFIDSEQHIKALFQIGTYFKFEGTEYKVIFCDKPRPARGECKTDVYIKGETANGEIKELKISVKQDNADFLENKISIGRAKEIFGENASQIIKNCTESIKENFLNDYLICFKKHGRTEAHTIKLGWKFELLNKPGGEKSGLIQLTDQQKHDIFAGINMSDEKKNCRVNNHIIENSGVANYILNLKSDNLNQTECLQSLQPIEDFAKTQTIYFACKALNFRFDKDKWDGPRPLSVFVDWHVADGKLAADLIFDKSLEMNGNESGNKLKNALNYLKIKDFDELYKVLSPGIKYYS